jgi:hypothetical protein
MGCAEIREQIESEANVCPQTIKGLPHPSNSGIEWTARKSVSANIKSVVIECIPRRIAATEKTSASTEYQIATTATIAYSLSMADYGTFNAFLKFEAVTAKGVVLKSGSSFFKLVRGSTSGNASAVITGFSPEEISRVDHVNVGWEY